MTTTYPHDLFGVLLQRAMVARLSKDAKVDERRAWDIVNGDADPTLNEAADLVGALGMELHVAMGIRPAPSQEPAQQPVREHPDAIHVAEPAPDLEAPQPVLQPTPAPQASALALEPTAADPAPAPKARGRRERVLELLLERPRNRLDLASALDLPAQTVDGILSRAARDGVAHLKDGVWHAGQLRTGDWRDDQPWGLVPSMILSEVTGKVPSVISKEHKARGFELKQGGSYSRSPEGRWGRLVEAWGAERARAWVAGCERWREDLEAFLSGEVGP